MLTALGSGLYRGRWLAWLAFGPAATPTLAGERLDIRPPDYANHNLVFAPTLGTRLGHRNVLRSFKQALQRAGLPATMRMDDLRQTSATLMRAGGVPLTVASRRLGHSTIRVTADLYQHVDAALDTDAAERLGKALQA